MLSPRNIYLEPSLKRRTNNIDDQTKAVADRSGYAASYDGTPKATLGGPGVGTEFGETDEDPATPV